jgi:hypothetical protein
MRPEWQTFGLWRPPHYFDKDQATIVWLIDKDTLNIQKTFELPAQFVFHFVNAYEQGNEVVFESTLSVASKLLRSCLLELSVVALLVLRIFVSVLASENFA